MNFTRLELKVDRTRQRKSRVYSRVKKFGKKRITEGIRWDALSVTKMQFLIGNWKIVPKIGSAHNYGCL